MARLLTQPNNSRGWDRDEVEVSFGSFIRSEAEAESAAQASRGQKLSGAWTIPLGVAHLAWAQRDEYIDVKAGA